MRPFVELTARVQRPRLLAHVHGERALEFLHAVLSQDVEGLKPGQGALGCYLDEKAHVLAEVRALCTPDGSVSLDAEEAAREGLESMARIAPLSGVLIEIEPIVATIVRGPDADSLVELPPEPYSVVESNGALVVRETWGLNGFDVLGVTDVDAPKRSIDEYELARITAGRPLFGIDVPVGTLINETPYLAHAVSFTKGCYPGQESVARIANLGRARRRLVGLRAPGETAPEAITPGAVTPGAHDAVVVTSASRAPDGWVALAYVRAEVADIVELAGVRVAVVELS